MIQSVKRARQLNSTHPILHACIIKLIKYLKNTDTMEINPYVKIVIQKSFNELIGQKTPQELNDEFIKNNDNSILHLLQGAKIMYELDSSKKEKAINLITSFDVSKSSLDVSIYSFLYHVHVIKYVL